jgi:hypothetical protein
MRKTSPREIRSKNLLTVVGAILLTTSLTFLVACQGVSSGGSNQSSVLSATNSTLAFGTVAAGSSKTLTVSIQNSGPNSVTISSAAISSQYFSLTAPSLPATVAAGQSTTVSVMFTPNAAGTFNATLSVTSNASNSVTTISLTGSSGSSSSPGQLALNPSSQAFPSVIVGAQQSATVTLTNIGGSSVDISQASVAGTGFQLSGISAPLTLAASQSTTFTVTFAPQSTGSTSGTVTITSDGSNPSLTMALSGAGISLGELGSNPTSLSFGTVTVGSDSTLSETVTNTGGTSITISNVAISGTGFSLSGITAPVTLSGGKSATFSVKFAPTATGSASGSVAITSNAPNSTLAIGLSGTGGAVPTFSVNLSWDASSSSDIAGYNIYRAVYTNLCGSFNKLNSSLETAMQYTDTVVVDGTSYCYATTAVNTNDEESGYSNIVSNVQIPSQ